MNQDQLAVSIKNELDEDYCYSIKTLAKRWGVSREKVRRMMLREPDVLIFASDQLPGKRIFRRFSIPGAVAKRVERRVMNVRKVS
jgi:hypothetical protein